MRDVLSLISLHYYNEERRYVSDVPHFITRHHSPSLEKTLHAPAALPLRSAALQLTSMRGIDAWGLPHPGLKVTKSGAPVAAEGCGRRTLGKP